ncbi:MAG: CRISPR-associated protein Cas5 [Candidatus Caldatribacteriaceae bacterium]
MVNVVVFDLVGPFAHFRKYYTNSSSLSYTFPPRTVLMGTVAAILGWERDSYYGRLGLSEARFAVVIKAPIRHLIQTVNYIRTKSEDLGQMRKFEAMKGTQIPLELLLPGDTASSLCFRVYFAHRDESVTQELRERLATGRFHYPLYLGLTEFIAQARLVYYGPPNEVIPAGEEVELHSVLPADYLRRPVLKEGVTLNRERAPQSFGAGRKLMPPRSYIYEMQARPWRAELTVPAYSFFLPCGRETVAFMEGELWPSSPIVTVKESA